MTEPADLDERLARLAARHAQKFGAPESAVLGGSAWRRRRHPAAATRVLVAGLSVSGFLSIIASLGTTVPASGATASVSGGTAVATGAPPRVVPPKPRPRPKPASSKPPEPSVPGRDDDHRDHRVVGSDHRVDRAGFRRPARRERAAGLERAAGDHGTGTARIGVADPDADDDPPQRTARHDAAGHGPARQDPSAHDPDDRLHPASAAAPAALLRQPLPLIDRDAGPVGKSGANVRHPT